MKASTLVLLVAVASTALAVPALADDYMFTAALNASNTEESGAGDVTGSNANALANFTLTAPDVNSSDDNWMWSLNITGLDGLIMGHLHLGNSTTSGPVVVQLLPQNSSAKFTNPVDSPANGVLSYNGTFNSSSLNFGSEEPDAIDALNYFFDEDIYINLHTTDYPAGAIRAQLVPTSTDDWQFDGAGMAIGPEGYEEGAEGAEAPTAAT
jgi:hypothetical protein